ncbi:hypothetical protein BO83DRAFT_410488 [Aspergillus eucalypticola CBS 122712]|uniref:Uncharacterized protein n=1 Tax=Aspergillus eucalypticola (strain CBS 122712 / IBT 29274) TaxID=1448314 RepID=A0A317V0N8_ASPEC|nr:uncharacterized protein BO83DRAFT_410488 [Aspergillus eucalypticola CBS 122712]PWY66638.1 hypothetical protein BO83DRAFT_410488 [Aspergillus eucalypticola CBS 122712]
MTAERSLFRFLNWSQECGPKQPNELGGKKGKEEEKQTRMRIKRKERSEASEIEGDTEEGEEEGRSKRSRRKGGEGSECGLVQPRPAVEKGHFALGPGDHVPSGLRVSQALKFVSATTVLGLIAFSVIVYGCAPDVPFQIRLGCINLATNSRQFTGSVKHTTSHFPVHMLGLPLA